jgi:hypothetical protein
MTVDYYSYIKSDLWYARTTLVRKRNRGICECCRMRFGEVVHHRSYERLGEEHDLDLVHLCLDCHSATHGKADKRFWIWESRLYYLRMLQDEMIKINLYGEKS